MGDYPYTTVNGKIVPLFNKIRESGVPAKVDKKWLESVGFTASNDHTLLRVVRYIGFVDKSGTPTEIWHQYRGTEYAQVLGDAIRKSYAGLFATYAKAHLRTDSDITNFMMASSTASEKTVSRMVDTFRKLCSLAHFSELSGEIELADETIANTAAGEGVEGGGVGNDVMPSLHIDVQIHISPDTSPKQIDKIFESMAKHLYQARSD
ncbi:MAG: DUF5343 domain-containing protein [Euryarchaeota archaeon]|nr:DUF5343 domain-containing protein [Euryarchaeota archaeon]